MHRETSAIERTPAEQAAYLAEACGEDQELRHEVESLLINEDRGALLEWGALEVAARQFNFRMRCMLEASSVQVTVPDLVGRKLGRYQVISRLERGPMGEVYLARDTRLKPTSR
jgi:hypothetical protein